MFRLPMTMISTIFAAAALIIISSVFCLASAQAPVGAPLEAPMGPSAAATPSESSFGPAAAGPTSSNDCLTLVFNTSDCLSYVQEGSNTTVPDQKCCPELAGLVDTNPICLCQLLSSSSSYGISLDLSRALALPSICNVSTPPVSTCAAAGYPVAAPTPSQVSIPPAANPATGKDGSGASSIAKSAQAYSFVLAVAFVFTFFF